MPIIQCKGMALEAYQAPVDQFLMAYDPKTGESNWSLDKSKALRFNSKLEAFRFYIQILESDPIRPDGRPNRPLTAFTVLIEEDK